MEARRVRFADYVLKFIFVECHVVCFRPLYDTVQVILKGGHFEFLGMIGQKWRHVPTNIHDVHQSKFQWIIYCF